MSKRFFLLCVAVSIGGCVAPQQRQAPAPHEIHAFKPIEFKYDTAAPEASNFYRQLDLPAWQCDLEVTSGNTAVRYGNRRDISEYNDSLTACIVHAYAQGNQAVERLKAARVPSKQADLSKDLYAKWSAYLGTMSPYRATDPIAKSSYEAAKQALITEIKFSK